MAFAADLQAVAESLLDQYGFSITVTRDVIGAYNTAAGTVTDSADTTFTGVGYPSQYNSQDIDGHVIRQHDIRLIFYSTTLPKVNDIFSVNSRSYTAQNVERITAEAEDIIYIVQLRQ
jgi:hypothetical protein